MGTLLPGVISIVQTDSDYLTWILDGSQQPDFSTSINTTRTVSPFRCKYLLHLFRGIAGLFTK